MIQEKFVDRFARNSGIKDKFIAEREVDAALEDPSCSGRAGGQPSRERPGDKEE